MRRGMYAVTALVCVTLSVMAGLHAASAIKPVPPQKAELWVEKPVIDFGIIQPNETISTTVRVQNRFQMTLEVRELIRNCGCTDVSLEPMRLEPGQEGVLKLGLRAGADRIPMSKAVLIVGNLVHNDVTIPFVVTVKVVAEVK